MVGERTRGGANPVEIQEIFGKYVVYIPATKSVSSLAASNWEGVGVKPDIEVPADQAPAAAQAEALKKLAEMATDEKQRAYYTWALAGVQGKLRPPTVETSLLQSYAGVYGERKIHFENGALFFQRGERAKLRLTPLAPDLFLVDTLDQLRLRFVKGGDGSIQLETLYDDGRVTSTPQETGQAPPSPAGTAGPPSEPNGSPRRTSTSFPTWPWLGQEPPGATPVVFAPKVITFGNHEHHLSLSPDGTEMFYVVADKYRKQHVILTLKKTGVGWSKPEVAPFSGTCSDFAPTIAPDGQTLFFCSNRPLPGDPAQTGDFNLWRCRKTAGGWDPPEPLPFPVNDESNEYNPSVARSGNLYFQDNDAGGVDLYVARWVDGRYQAPEKLSPEINTPSPEIAPWISPDEAVLYFSSDRPGGRGSMDIYHARRNPDGSWQAAVNAGEEINSPYGEAVPTLSPDGQYLFFVGFRGLAVADLKGKDYDAVLDALNSPANRDGALYWVKAPPLQP